MIILEKNIILTPEEKGLIDHFEGNSFPFFYTKTTSDNFHQFSHGFLRRSLVRDDRGREMPVEGIINSVYYEDVIKLFDRICRENNIPYDKIYRAALNTTYYYPNLHGDIHKDHEFDHYIFIMYLNDFDYGYTFLFDDYNRITNIIHGERNKFVIFKGVRHAQGFCSLRQRRMILIITFGMKDK